jgi:hypothetical protein
MVTIASAGRIPRRIHHMTKLRIAPVVLGMLALGVPASASASNPLLSGYGGPGGGEQVILGSKLLPPGGGSGGGSGTAPVTTGAAGLRASGPATGSAPSAGTSASSSSAGGTPSRQTGASHHKASRAGGGKNGKGDRSGTTAANRRAAPPVVAYPTRASDAGGVLGDGALLLIGLAAGGLVLLGVGLRRLAPHTEAPS